MDIDWSEDEVIFYPSHDQVRKMLLGESIHRNLKKRNTLIDYTYEKGEEKVWAEIVPEDPQHRKRNKANRYDDVLDALEECYILIECLKEQDEIGEGMRKIFRSFETAKIQSTYLFHKDVAEKYR